MIAKDLTITSQAHADELRAAIRIARVQINYLEVAKTAGLYLEGASDHFPDASTGIEDLIADRMAELNRATEALEEWDAAQAYGERPRYAAVVHGGSI